MVSSKATGDGLEGPRLDAGKRILVVGASGDMGLAVLQMLAHSRAKIGAHSYRSTRLQQVAKNGRIGNSEVKLYAADLSRKRNCHALVDSFVDWAGGIDALVQVSGNVSRPVAWEMLSQGGWLADINVNLSGPFFLSQRVATYMKSGGGRIILTSTASARHGGGGSSIAYGVAKAGIECLVKGLARAGAPYGILVNAVAPGFIATQFHSKRMGHDQEALERRAALVPLKRAGRPEDVARLIVYLLSPGGDFITGECIAVSGGDWL